MSNKKILVLPGDGIGNEVMAEVLNIIDWLSKTRSMSFDISERLVGGTAYDKEGDSISDSTMQEALDNIVLMPSITHVVQLNCDETDENWTRQGNLDLNDLRKVRDLITDEKELFEVLTSTENNKT